MSGDSTPPVAPVATPVPPKSDAQSSGSDAKDDPTAKKLSSSGLPKKYFCKICNQGFTRKHNMISHDLIHSTAKPHTCKVCNLKFRRIHDLKRHEKLHTGEKPHECDKCHKKFTRNDALARHQNSPNACTPTVQTSASSGEADDEGTSQSAGSADGDDEERQGSSPMPGKRANGSNGSTNGQSNGSANGSLNGSVNGSNGSSGANGSGSATAQTSPSVAPSQSPAQPPSPRSRPPLASHKSHFTSGAREEAYFGTANPIGHPRQGSQSNQEYSNYYRINDTPHAPDFPNNPYHNSVPPMLNNPPVNPHGVPSMGQAPAEPRYTSSSSPSDQSGHSSSVSTVSTQPTSRGSSVMKPQEFVPIEKYNEMLRYVKKMEHDVASQKERIRELEKAASDMKIIVKYLEERDQGTERRSGDKKHGKESDSDDSIDKPASKFSKTLEVSPST
ncbi:hypothetical protein DICA4_B04808 [Diutina catenulata]